MWVWSSSKSHGEALYKSPGDGSIRVHARDVPSLLAEKNDNVEFRIGTAENLPFVQDSSVDMISAGTAAHWFPPDWWTEASRICKKGATVAIFTIQGFYIHPSNPHAEQLQKMADEIKKNVFDPHAAPGNWILYNLYDELPLPQEGFSECTRIKWNVKGELKEGEDTYALSNRRTVDDMIALHYSFGPVNTFNKNNPELVGKPEHPLEIMRREMKALGFKDDDTILVGHTVSLLLFTKQ